MANNYTPAEWQAMRAGPPYGAPLPQTGAPAPAPGLATRRNDWITLRQPPQPHPHTTIGEMGDIMDLFDRLTDVVAQQRSSRIATNSYVLELEKLINKLRDCIDRLLALLQECRDNKIELERLRARIEQHPNLNLIRDQLTDTIAEMQNDQLDPDQFRGQLAELVGEIKKICDEVDNMRRAGFGDGGGQGGQGGQGWQARQGYPGENDGARGAPGARGLGRGARGRGAPGARGTGRGGRPRRGPPGRGSARGARGGPSRRGSARGGPSRHDGPNRGEEEKTETRSEETKDGDGWQPPQVIQDEIDALNAQADAIGRNTIGRNTIGDGGDGRRRAAARTERELGEGSGSHSDGFGNRVSTGRGLGGGWQTPEKLQSLSKSKPIRTLDSIKRKKSKRGNKSKRRRKKTKGRRNKKKKQTKRKRNKKRKKKRTRKR